MGPDGRQGPTRPAAADAARGKLTAATDVADLAGCALVVEAAVESLDVKRAIFAGLEAWWTTKCVLATNTSSLSITAVAAALRHPGRCVGMHFFNPAPVMKLVEVVSGLQTDQQIASAVAAVATLWGKTAVRVASTPGFIVNRVARPFYGEAFRTLDEAAADPATIDAVMREAGGFRMGPLELTDLIGQDVNLAVGRSVWELFGQDPRYAPSLAQQALVDAGRLGTQVGAGFLLLRRRTPTHRSPRPRPSARRSPGFGSAATGDLGPGCGIGWRTTVSMLPQATAAVGRGRNCPTVRLSSRPMDEWPPSVPRKRVGRCWCWIWRWIPRPATRFAVAASPGCPPAHLAATGRRCCSQRVLPSACWTTFRDCWWPGRPPCSSTRPRTSWVARSRRRPTSTLAMRLGVGYPIGPLEWGDRIGAHRLVVLLDALSAIYRDGRYRACTTLRRAAWSGRLPS